MAKEESVMFEISNNSVIALYVRESQPSQALDITFRVLQLPVAAACLTAGATKLAGADMHVATFAKMGMDQWFRYFTGGLAVICAILAAMPRTLAIAATVPAANIVGAIRTHLFIIGGSRGSRDHAPGDDGGCGL